MKSFVSNRDSSAQVQDPFTAFVIEFVGPGWNFSIVKTYSGYVRAFGLAHSHLMTVASKFSIQQLEILAGLNPNRNVQILALLLSLDPLLAPFMNRATIAIAFESS